MLAHNLNFVLLGLIFTIAAVFARRLINLNLWVYESVGLVSLAGFWRRQLGWWLPTVRMVSACAAFVFILIGAGII